MYRLLQSALRQRPEYLLVGEIRTEQRVAFTFFQAIATGHTAYTTVHADSIEGALSRLENEPLAVPDQMLQEVDVISIQRQIFHDGNRVRRNEVVTEVIPGEEPGEVATSTVFARDAQTDDYSRVNDSHVLDEIRDARGWTEDDLESALAVREEVLSYLVDNEFRSYEAVTAAIHTFAKDPEFVLNGIRDGTFDPEELVARAGRSRPGEFDGIDADDTADAVDDTAKRVDSDDTAGTKPDEGGETDATDAETDGTTEGTPDGTESTDQTDHSPGTVPPADVAEEHEPQAAVDGGEDETDDPSRPDNENPAADDRSTDGDEAGR